jgi:hypothetical protein
MIVLPLAEPRRRKTGLLPGAPTYRSLAGASRHRSQALLTPPRMCPCRAGLVRAFLHIFFIKKVPDLNTSRSEKYTDFKKLKEMFKIENCSDLNFFFKIKIVQT